LNRKERQVRQENKDFSGLDKKICCGFSFAFLAFFAVQMIHTGLMGFHRL